MIISYHHRFIFLHCRKVAGSALQVWLSRHLGPNDIQLGTREDLRAHGMRQPGRFYRDILSATGLRSLGRRFIRHPTRFLPAHLGDTLGRVHKDVYGEWISPYAGHAPAAHVRRFDEQAWDSFFKFCFVRNPYERAVSDYIWRIRARNREESFHQYLLEVRERMATEPPESPRYDNWPIYTIDDRVAVDFVGRYENLRADLDQVCERLGLPVDELPVAKKVARGYDYREYYGEREKALVGEIYRREIEHFDYRF